jgi:signal transduction histidine kinase
MKENALALPSIVETARSNAEEGLQQIRKAMYRLRQQETAYPTGLNAIARLFRVFERATSIRIQCDFGSVPATVSDEIDSVIYHLVQEALVNSFRHGRATEVHVQFWEDGESLNVHMRDNGVGSAEVAEGIGLRGMRERVEGMGGSVRAGTVTDGFLVAASIPVATVSHGAHDDEKLVDHPDR